MDKKSQYKPKSEQESVMMFEGIYRRTLCYDDDNMLCHFTLEKGSSIPLHSHVAVQNGYVISGKVKFLAENGDEIIVNPGDGYFFKSNEVHGSEVMEDSEIIECFSPVRPEYK
jgi:quercetin dioxygenase-like cupin family protein